jgi:hypothetical protein
MVPTFDCIHWCEIFNPCEQLLPRTPVILTNCMRSRAEYECADLASETSSARSELQNPETLSFTLPLVLAHDVDEVGEVLLVKASSEGVLGIQQVVLLVLRDGFDWVLQTRRMPSCQSMER